jgi:hypothetical protein
MKGRSADAASNVAAGCDGVKSEAIHPTFQGRRTGRGADVASKPPVIMSTRLDDEHHGYCSAESKRSQERRGADASSNTAGGGPGEKPDVIQSMHASHIGVRMERVSIHCRQARKRHGQARYE